MRKFWQHLMEAKAESPVVFSYGRMNPPTIGHQVLINKVHELANQHNAPHEVVLSHTQDGHKNPLTPDQKLAHAQKFFPDTNITTSDSNHPTLLHHAARLNQAGHDHLIMVAGSDRVPEYQKLLNRYNGQPDNKGQTLYKFKKIDVVSAGQRDPDAEGAEGMSASKMREHARNGDYESFKQGIPTHVSDKDSKKLFNDVQGGLR